jgi:photosystem II stability/assembly factor-like uncharacterized protein
MRSKVVAGWPLSAGAGAVLWLALCAAVPCLAGGWESIGPSGSDQFLVQPAPNDSRTLYSLSHHSVHVSTNRAVSWRAIHDATMNRGIFLGLAFPAHDTSNILVSRTEGGLSQTLNGGQTWKDLTAGLPADTTDRRERVTISSMVTLPDGKVVGGVRSKVAQPAWAYSLAPGATNWTAQGQGMSVVVPETDLSNVPTTFVSLDAGTNLWAVLYGGGVFRWSTNRWESRSAGLPPEALRATFLAHDMTKSGSALLGTEDGWVYSTTNAGASWARLPLPSQLQALQAAGSPLPFVYMVAIDPANPEVIIVRANDVLSSHEIFLFKARSDQTAGSGTYVSLDGGEHWFLQPLYAVRMAFDATETESGGNPPLQGVTRSKFVYTTSVGPDSFYSSTNGGSSFAISDNGIYTYFCNALSWSSALNATLVGGEEGISRLSRGSNAWNRINAVTGFLYVWSFAADHQNPSNILYATGYPSWGFTNQMGIYRMPPDAFQGAGWTPDAHQILAGTGVWRVVTSPARPAAIYAASQEHGILLSEDGGGTWSNRNAGLSLPCSVTDVELDQGGKARYASVRASSGNPLAEPLEPWVLSPDETGGVYRANATNGNWEMMPGLTGAVVDVEMTVADGITNLYAAGADGVHVCRDGRTWEPLLVSRYYSAYDLLVHPTRTDHLYVATTAGVLCSTNGGNAWQDFSDGLTLRLVQSLALDERTDTLYAGTLGNSVFRRALSVHQGATIIAPPADCNVLAPADAAFSVTAAGDAPLAYRWRRNGNPIAGATNATYTLSPTSKAADNGATFDVMVSNPYGSVTSAAATLTVRPAGRPSLSIKVR